MKDYLWDAIGSIQQAMKEPKYATRVDELRDIYEQLDNIHDALFYQLHHKTKGKTQNGTDAD